MIQEKIFSFISECGVFRGKMHSEVTIYEERIEIVRDTKWKVAPKTILYYEDITSIVHKKGGFAVGEQWISFSVPGVNPRYMRTADMGTTYIDLGIDQAPWTDENSIIFRKDNNEVTKYFEKIQEVYGNYKRNKRNDNIKVTDESSMDRLRKLKELYDLGILDKTEYEEKRTKLVQDI